MDLEYQILFFFSAIGVFNALLISAFFFFFKKPKQISNYFLGFLLLMLAIRVGKSVVYYFYDDLSEVFLQIGISACLLIGPSLYYYIAYTTNPLRKSNGTWVYHYIILFLSIMVLAIFYPWKLNPDLWSFSIIDVVYWIWFCYILASGFLLKDSLTKILGKSGTLSSLEFWLLSLFFGNFIVWAAYRTAAYTSYIVGALTFSFIFYLLILLIYFNRKKDAIFNVNLKYADKKIPETEAKELLMALETLLVDEKMYQNPNLKLKDLASGLNLLPHRVSQLLNDNVGKSFSNFINEFRIEEAKSQIASEQNITLEAIGYECGFNSKSTFYTAFKRHTGMTPAQFRERPHTS